MERRLVRVPRVSVIVLQTGVLCLIATAGMYAAERDDAVLERGFAEAVRPFLGAYCTGCHGGSSPAARFDLSLYSTAGAVVRDYDQWARVLERLSSEEMPPKGVKQPPALDRQRVIEWIRAMRAAQARKNAGDPGPVLARR